MISFGFASNAKQMTHVSFATIAIKVKIHYTPFQLNDILHDITMLGSDHNGHDVYFYHSNSGGCCDCGDSQAWDKKGFCKKHGRIDVDPLSTFPSDITARANNIVDVVLAAIFEFCTTFQRFVLFIELIYYCL